MTTLKNLRQGIQQQRLALSAETIANNSQRIAEKLIALTAYDHARRIACYIAHAGEVDSSYIWEHAWQQGKQVYLPVLDPKINNTLLFLAFHPEDKLVPNRFGILEPALKVKNSYDPAKLDLIILPLVAFDDKANRIGMGAGYYDRTLAFMQSKPIKPKLIGIAYDFQRVAEIIPQPWDIRLDCVITPSNPK